MSKIMRALLLVLVAASAAMLPGRSSASLLISINIAPPALPVYVQPECPGDGYIWTPGYWAYDDEGGYFWVPGTWVLAPEPGLLWTPGYWGWNGGVFGWNAGYWGPHVGFYGGVNYGFGYGGVGFAGGRWAGGVFQYNSAVMNIGSGIHNSYHETVINNVTVNNVSFNGGEGGIRAEPTAEERQFAGERHVQPTSEQTQHIQQAAGNKDLFARNNGGKPAIAATPRPGAFSGPGVVGAKEGAHLSEAQMHPPPAEQARAIAAAHPAAGHEPALGHAPAPAHAPAPVTHAPAVTRPQTEHAAPPTRPAPRPQAAPPRPAPQAAPRPAPQAPHPQAAPRPAPAQHQGPPPKKPH